MNTVLPAVSVSQLSGVSSMAEAPRRPVRPVRRAREDFMVVSIFLFGSLCRIRWLEVGKSLVEMGLLHL
jgi:hypothetical protein